MKPRKFRRFVASTLPTTAFLAMSAAAVGTAFAADVVWDGGPSGTGTDLGVAANWTGDVLPNNTVPDTAVWNGTATGPLSLLYTAANLTLGGAPGLNLSVAATQVDPLTLNSEAGVTTGMRINNITVASGAGAFTLGNGTDDFHITIGNANTQTHTWANNSTNVATGAADLRLGLGGAGNHALAITGSGNWAFNGSLAPSNAANLSLQKTGAGELTLSGGGSFNNAGTGTINAYGGVFSAVLKEGTTRITNGAYACNNVEFVVGGLDTVGTNTQLILDGGSLTGVSWLSIGRGNGTGTTSSDVILNNATSISAVNMSGGYNANNTATAPKGSLTLNNTSSVTATTTVNIAESAGSNITLNLNGTSTFSQTANSAQTRVGMADNAVGTINVNGGTANFERDLVLGSGGTGQGKLMINSGTVNVAGATERWLILNQGTGAGSGEITVNGGSLNLNTNTDIRMSQNAGSAGTNTVTLTSGAITGYSGNKTGLGATSVVDLQNNGTAAVNNSFHLDGGTLSIGQIMTSVNTGTAAFNFNGGLLRANGSNANFIDLGGTTQTVNVEAGGAKIDSNGFNVTIIDPLLSAGSDGGLAKSGAGRLTIADDANYDGPTTITAGELLVGIGGGLNNTSGVSVTGGGKFNLVGLISATAPVTITDGSIDGEGDVGTVTVADLATNTVFAGNGNASDLTIDTLAFQGDAKVSLRANGGATTQTVITSNLTTTPANGVITVDVNNTGGAWTGDPAGWEYVLIDHDGSYTGNAAVDFAVGTLTPPLAAGQTAAIEDNGFEIVLVVTGDPLNWAPTVNANWDTTTSNWSDSSGSTTFSNGQSVVFDDGAAELDVNLATNVEPGVVRFSNFSDDYTISSTGGFGINGSASLVIDGGGLVTIETVNGYTGTTSIVNGGLQLSGSGSIASSSEITVGVDGELIFDHTGTIEYANPITGTGTTNAFWGTEAITKRGTGTLTLSGTNTFTGDFAFDAGQLNLNSAGALGAAGGTIVINGGVLDNTSGAAVNMAPDKPVTLNSDLSFIGTNDLYLSNGAVTIGANRTVEVQAGVFGMGAPLDGGAGFDLTKTGPGYLALNGGDIRGDLNIQSGIVGINQDFFGAAPVGTGILENAGDVATKWTFWYGPDDVSSNLLIRNNDGTNTTQLGIVKRGSGSLTLTNPSNVATANISVDSGKLVLNAGTYGARLDDGTTNTGLVSLVGNTAAANGVLVVDGATVNWNNRSAPGTEIWRHTLDIANNGTGAGAMLLNSGTITTDKELTVGTAGGAYGSYLQTDGTATIGGFLAIGLSTAQGSFSQTGGQFNLTSAPVTNGAGAGSFGVMNFSGTAVYNHTSTGDAGLWNGESGTGVVNVSGGASVTIAAANDGLQLGRNAAGVGVLNLLGGTTTVQKVYKGAGTGRLNFNGGTLAANAASGTFIAGLTSASVRAGGGTIHNGGNAITISQALVAPAGDGVSATGLSVSGSGFIGAPIVTITGDGTGATAVANVDAAGNLTGITVTNPGTGYTTAPTFALLGGGIGNTGSITGTSTLVPNVSGGMSFTGAAITTLTGVNTYTGSTTIGSGTTLVVGSGGEVTVAPAANGVSSKITGAGTVSIDGKIRVDTAGTDITNGNAWTVVDAATRVYNTVTFRVSIAGVGDLVPQGDGVTHTLVDGANTWTFSETTGQLALAVSAGGGGFESWIGGFGLAVGDQDPLDDPDSDGVSNLAEYYLGRDPSESEGAASSAVKNGANLELTFSRSDLAQSNADATLLIEYGSNLVGWTAVAVPAADGTVGDVAFTITDGTPNDTVKASIPTGGASGFFARVKVVK